ncbi:hypothetical protein UB37_18465 [Photobacterium iliopiscarium]|nr:hypothetical protein [Photobacterium iliopiscarium]KJG19411.1 hypothetical protein UB37_18465 [Photobacterium iliopiscarium]
MLLDYISNLQTKPTPTDLRNPEKTYKCNVKENIFPEITTGTLNRVFDNLSPFSTKVINYQNHKMFMDKTTMIYNLVLLASKANTKIRWFLFDNDSDPCPKSGEWYMRPWNSKEIHAGASAAIMPLTVIYSLTITNKYSLVFHSLKSEGSGVSSIFYSADSNFKFIKNANSNKSQRTLDMPKLEERAIVTATHHGSNDEAHKPFYDYFSGSDYLYVRSDRDCCSRPTSKLKNFQTKYCTICRTSKATCCITINKSTLASSATFSPKIELEFTKCSVGWTTTQTVCCCQF